MNSDFIKLQLMKYFRFDRQFTFACSECINNSDIMAIREKSTTEIEVKISKADFKKEFETKITPKNYNKVHKHEAYRTLIKPYERYFIPNYFYFCVPLELRNWALDYLKDKNLKYGLLICDDHKQFNKFSHIFVAKSASKLHSEKPSMDDFFTIGRRVQSEMIKLKERVLLEVNK